MITNFELEKSNIEDIRILRLLMIIIGTFLKYGTRSLEVSKIKELTFKDFTEELIIRDNKRL